MVAVLEPWTDIVTAATMIELVDGLVAEADPVWASFQPTAQRPLRGRIDATPRSTRPL